MDLPAQPRRAQPPARPLEPETVLSGNYLPAITSNAEPPRSASPPASRGAVGTGGSRVPDSDGVGCAAKAPQPKPACTELGALVLLSTALLLTQERGNLQHPPSPPASGQRQQRGCSPQSPWQPGAEDAQQEWLSYTEFLEALAHARSNQERKCSAICSRRT